MKFSILMYLEFSNFHPYLSGLIPKATNQSATAHKPHEHTLEPPLPQLTVHPNLPLNASLELHHHPPTSRHWLLVAKLNNLWWMFTAGKHHIPPSAAAASGLASSRRPLLLVPLSASPANREPMLPVCSTEAHGAGEGQKGCRPNTQLELKSWKWKASQCLNHLLDFLIAFSPVHNGWTTTTLAGVAEPICGPVRCGVCMRRRRRRHSSHFSTLFTLSILPPPGKSVCVQWEIIKNATTATSVRLVRTLEVCVSFGQSLARKKRAGGKGRENANKTTQQVQLASCVP